MNQQGILNENTHPDQHHMYHMEVLVIDGKTYPVISVIPIAGRGRAPETARDKIRYLISGEKQ